MIADWRFPIADFWQWRWLKAPCESNPGDHENKMKISNRQLEIENHQ